MEEGLLGRPMSPLESTRMSQPHSLASAKGGVVQLEYLSTTDHVEVSQPQVAASTNGEAHQPLGPEPVESAMIEDGWSMGAIPNSSVPTPLVPSAPKTSA